MLETQPSAQAWLLYVSDGMALICLQANRKDELLLRRKLMGQCATRGVHASWFKGENLIYAPAYDPAASIQVGVSSPATLGKVDGGISITLQGIVE